MKKKKKVIAFVLTAVLAAEATLCYGENLTEKQQQAQQDKEELQQQLQEVKTLLEDLNQQKETLEGTVQELDQMGSRSAQVIHVLQQKIDEQQKKLDKTQEKLDNAKAKHAKEYERVKQHICFVYENDNSRKYVDYLLTSGGMSEFLNRVQYISEVTEYDRKLLKEYQGTVEQIQTLTNALDEQQEELLRLKRQQQQQKNTTDQKTAQKQEELHEVDGSIRDAQELEAYYQAELRAQEAILTQIRGMLSEGHVFGTQLSAAGLIWPCPTGTRVSSDYGPRTAPIAGASTFHRGIDIPASEGDDIIAAADGVVSYVGYEANGGGNYCIVGHGTINTVYMHASQICVEAGQEVHQGDVIAKVGSTGIATGPHLHFAISVDGEYVNPWTYLQ